MMLEILLLKKKIYMYVYIIFFVILTCLLQDTHLFMAFVIGAGGLGTVLMNYQNGKIKLFNRMCS